ncbi:MAG: HD domain-containing protein [Kiritimatiellae bacterium]|nr:HD domain-containing protein [Kiritimatiellia bacterium]
MNRSERLIKDPVHGYISVPRDFFDKFIDTPIFQRLRNIEQTSMRPLYPAAHHDRFIHSLGVYHLGCKIVRNLSAQRGVSECGVSDEEWLRTTKSFEIACLLHDCGHAPFSHTYEIYYNHSKTGIKRAERYLLRVANDRGFQSDFEDMGAPPAPHESFSAYLVVSVFSLQIKEAGGDPILVARMITGIKNTQVSAVNRLEDIFINLLNGSPIDVDKLDYILRDTWASGVKRL